MPTKPKKSIREIPFSLAYGSEAVTPTEIVVPSHRVKHFETTLNDKQRRVDLDLVGMNRWTSEKIQ